uniref:Tyrosinase copper-binding domain-containing protein n=1 Tax=Meloidogyne incognita TaxID=6306 RepID=A0A914LAT7_MELIC
MSIFKCYLFTLFGINFIIYKAFCQQKYDCNKEPTFGLRALCKATIANVINAENAEKLDPKYSPNNTEGIAPSRRELECVSQSCVCPYYGGKTNGSINDCTLRTGQKVQKALRKEIRMLTDEERNAFFNAIRDMKRRGDYDYIALIHRLAFVNGGAHNGPAFFLWHREYLKRFEILLRKYNPTLGLPYWDSTLDGRLPNPADSILFTKEFIGTTDNQGYVVTGPFTPWRTIEGDPYITRNVGKIGRPFTEYDVYWTLSQTKLENVLAYTSARLACPVKIEWDAFEYPHGQPHFFVGGDMAAFIPNKSANDPIFFMHHCFVDLVFEYWREIAQNRRQRANDYPADIPACELKKHFKFANMTQFAPLQNWDGLRNEYTDNMFKFHHRPTCSFKTECGSKYLFCDRSHTYPLCTSKVRQGGNCTGFTNGKRRSLSEQ